MHLLLLRLHLLLLRLHLLLHDNSTRGRQGRWRWLRISISERLLLLLLLGVRDRAHTGHNR